MENNIKVFRVHRALSWLNGILVFLTIFFLITLIKDGEPFGDFIGILVLLIFFFLLHYFIGKGAKEKKAWAKVCSVIIAIILLFGFPIGTIIGIYLLINNSGWEASSVQSS